MSADGSTRRRRAAKALVAACATIAAGAAAAQVDDGRPRSAIPWLRDALDGAASGDAGEPTADPAQPIDPAEAPPLDADGPTIRELDPTAGGGSDERPAYPYGRGAGDAAATDGAAAGPTDVEVVALDEVDVAPLAYGPVGIAGVVAGLPSDAWRSADPSIALILVERLRPTDLTAANRLAVRLLSAALDAPPGADDGFLAARVDALTRFGAAAQAAELAAAGGGRRALLAADAAFVSGADRGYCRAVLSDRAPSVERIYCLAAQGRRAEAQLALDASRAVGDGTPVEIALLQALIEPDLADPAAYADAADLSPLALAVRRRLGLATPQDFARRSELALAAAALTDAEPPRARLEALERLEASGAATTEALRAGFEARRSAESGGVWGRVEAYRRAVGARDDAFAAAAEAALALAAAEGREAAMARLLGPAIQARALAGGGVDRRLATPALRRALRLAGLGDAASALMADQSGEGLSAGLDDAERAVDRLASSRWSALWGPARSADLTARAARGDQSAGRLLAALDAFGVPTQGARRYDAEHDLALSIDEGRAAERAFEALIMLSPGSDTTPAALHAALARLIAVGLDEDARQIAIEAALMVR